MLVLLNIVHQTLQTFIGSRHNFIYMYIAFSKKRKLMKGNALMKHSLHEKTAASVLEDHVQTENHILCHWCSFSRDSHKYCILKSSMFTSKIRFIS